MNLPGASNRVVVSYHLSIRPVPAPIPLLIHPYPYQSSLHLLLPLLLGLLPQGGVAPGRGLLWSLGRGEGGGDREGGVALGRWLLRSLGRGGGGGDRKGWCGGNRWCSCYLRWRTGWPRVWAGLGFVNTWLGLHDIPKTGYWALWAVKQRIARNIIIPHPWRWNYLSCNTLIQ